MVLPYSVPQGGTGLSSALLHTVLGYNIVKLQVLDRAVNISPIKIVFAFLVGELLAHTTEALRL